MTVKYVGPVCVEDFLNLLPKAKTPTPKFNYSRILPSDDTSSGQGLYDTLKELIGSTSCSPYFDFCDTSHTADALTCLKPDSVMLSSGFWDSATFEEHNNYMWAVEVLFELRPTITHDPFCDVNGPSVDIDQPSVETITKQDADTRGRLVDHALKVLSLQHRTFIYTVCIFGNHARIIRWDRAGAIVSASFNYAETQSLGEFLWRYSHATRAERGFDESVCLATPQEDRTFTEAVMSHLEKFTNTYYHTKMQVTLDRFYPTHKIRVIDSTTKAASVYLVRRPFFNVPLSSDRATRGYIAWGVEEKELRFLKDSWRMDGTDSLSETEAYQLLQDLGAPHLPTLCKSGDVEFDGKPQRTLTDTLAGHKFSQDRPNGYARRRVHHRLVQKMALPLYVVKSSLQLTKAIRNVLVVIQWAFKHGKLLHRDISSGNVMLDDMFEGILNDWDHVIQFASTQESQATCVGTWPYISAALLQSPRTPHSIAHDVESCFWLLLDFARRHFGCEQVHLTPNLFDEVTLKADDNDEYLNCYGGVKKQHFLTSRSYRNVRCEPKPLKDIIIAFGDLLFNVYAYDIGRHVFPPYEEEYQKALKTIEDVDSVIKVFDEVVVSGDWPRENDARPDILRKRVAPQGSTTLPADLQSDQCASPAYDPTNPPLSLPCNSAFARRLQLYPREDPQMIAGAKRSHEGEERCEEPNVSRAQPRKRSRGDKTKIVDDTPKGPVTRSRSRAQSQQALRSRLGPQTRSMTRNARGGTLLTTGRRPVSC